MIPLHDDEWVNMEPQTLHGAHVEDTVSSALDGRTTYIERTVILPAVLDKIEITIGLAEVTK